MSTDEKLTTPSDTTAEEGREAARPAAEVRKPGPVGEPLAADEASADETADYGSPDDAAAFHDRDLGDPAESRDVADPADSRAAADTADLRDSGDLSDPGDFADSDAAPTTGDLPDATTATDATDPRDSAESDEKRAILDRWSKLQIEFVNDPRSAVADADALIGEIVDARRRVFDEHRTSLMQRWQRPEPDTEDLRLTLQDYRKVLGDLLPRQI